MPPALHRSARPVAIAAGCGAALGWLAIIGRAPRIGAELSGASATLMGSMALLAALGALAALRRSAGGMWAVALATAPFGLYLLLNEGLAQLVGAIVLVFLAATAIYGRPPAQDTG